MLNMQTTEIINALKFQVIANAFEIIGLFVIATLLGIIIYQNKKRNKELRYIADRVDVIYKNNPKDR